jgi:hypothetical protein
MSTALIQRSPQVPAAITPAAHEERLASDPLPFIFTRTSGNFVTWNVYLCTPCLREERFRSIVEQLQVVGYTPGMLHSLVRFVELMCDEAKDHHDVTFVAWYRLVDGVYLHVFVRAI